MITAFIAIISILVSVMILMCMHMMVQRDKIKRLERYITRIVDLDKDDHAVRHFRETFTDDKGSQ